MDKNGRYRHAIVGAGGIAQVHAEALRRLGGRCELVAVADVDPLRAAEFAARWEVPAAHNSIGDLLADQQPDVVHLCTPPAIRREPAIEILRAGANVLCEKPSTLSLRALDDIVRAEEVSSGNFGTIFQHRFGSAAGTLRSLVETGGLGIPLVAVCNTLWFRPDSYFDPDWRGRWSTEGGGPTLGHGIHQLDLLVAILGPWRDVVAVAARRARSTNTEDISSAIITFESGVVATVVNSLVSPRETSYLRFDFERATVEVQHLYGYRDEDWLVTPAPGHEEQVRTAWARGTKGVDSSHVAQFTAVLDALDEGEPIPVRSSEARATTELVAAIYASAFSGERQVRGQITTESPFYESMAGTGPPWAPLKAER